MVKAAIITDSSSDIPPDLAQALDIRIIPLKILFGAKVFHDRVDITPHEFYRRLRESKTLPTTSQPSAGDFVQIYQEVSRSAESIVSIHISGALSGTIESAHMAKTQMGESIPISIVDSRSTSMGLGFMVLAAARMAANGSSAPEIVAHVQKLIPRMNVLFVVDTLEYLHKGGRIGGAKRLLGSVLSIKPLLHLHDGQVDVLEQTRTKRGALTRLLEVVAERIGTARGVHMAIVHAEVPQEAMALREEIERRFPCQELYVLDLSPVLGVHTGPGVIGVAFYTEE
ncbi:MAG: DegV family protein [Chloroflexi bacterium]|nr:DegV family protein [Chloroflexota bacterium]